MSGFQEEGKGPRRDSDLEAKGRAHSRRVVEEMEGHRDAEEDEVLALISLRSLAECKGLMRI